MTPADGLDALDARRARAGAGKRRLPPARHPKVEQAPPTLYASAEVEQSTARAAESPAATPLKPVEAQQPEPAVELAPRRRTRVRATQVHLDEAADDHLTELRKRAVLADVDMTASAVLRLALSELVQHYGYDRIVAMVADDGGRIRRGRPRHIGP